MKFSFLTAYWQDLVIVNFEIDPLVLKKYIPRGTELDLFQNKAFLSLVAFRFNKNRLFGIVPSFPSYSFEEVNLRFYVRRGNKRAVTFIKEIVPSRLIACIAKSLYQEPYVALRTSSKRTIEERSVGLSYAWGDQLENTLHVESEKPLRLIESESFEEFILEHYWGYTPQADGSTVEYQVHHPKWRFGKVLDIKMSESVKTFYGSDFINTLSSDPTSVYIAEGSKVSVTFPRRFFHPLQNDHPKGWVLYDAACGFCSWWIPFWRKTINRCGYEIMPLQSEWARGKLELHEHNLANDIRLLLCDGTLINGADAYIYGMKKVWWSLPVGWILGLPGFRLLTWVFYKVFNRNRFLVSRMCKLKPEI